MTFFIVLATTLGAIGAITGGLASMLRNQPQLVAVSFGLIVFAVVGGIFARSIGGWWRPALLTLASAVFALGIYLGYDAEVHAMSSGARPRLSNVAWKPTTTGVELSGAVVASGLKATDEVQVAMYGVLSSTKALERLYYSNAGPSAGNSVVHEFSVPVTRGRYKTVLVTAHRGDQPTSCEGQPLDARTFQVLCGTGQGNTACLEITAPADTSQP